MQEARRRFFERLTWISSRKSSKIHDERVNYRSLVELHSFDEAIEKKVFFVNFRTGELRELHRRECILSQGMYFSFREWPGQDEDCARLWKLLFRCGDPLLDLRVIKAVAAAAEEKKSIGATAIEKIDWTIQFLGDANDACVLCTEQRGVLEVLRANPLSGSGRVGEWAMPLPVDGQDSGNGIDSKQEQRQSWDRGVLVALYPERYDKSHKSNTEVPYRGKGVDQVEEKDASDSGRSEQKQQVFLPAKEKVNGNYDKGRRQHIEDRMSMMSMGIGGPEMVGELQGDWKE